MNYDAPTEPTLADQPRHVRITTDGIAAQVTIGGQDISPLLKGYTLEQRVGQPPLLLLYASPHRDGTVFEGLARVAVADPQQDTGGEIAAFLGNINPAALEQAALARDDLAHDKYAVTTAILQTLVEWAQGGGS